MARGDVEMTDAEPPAAASSTPASGLPPGLAAAFEVRCFLVNVNIDKLIMEGPER